MPSKWEELNQHFSDNLSEKEKLKIQIDNLINNVYEKMIVFFGCSKKYIMFTNKNYDLKNKQGDFLAIIKFDQNVGEFDDENENNIQTIDKHFNLTVLIREKDFLVFNKTSSTDFSVIFQNIFDQMKSERL